MDARRAVRDALTAADARIAHARLATFFSGVLLANEAWTREADNALASCARWDWRSQAPQRIRMVGAFGTYSLVGGGKTGRALLVSK